MTSPETQRSSVMVERGGMPRWARRTAVVAGVAAASMLGIFYSGLEHERAPNGHMTIEAAPNSLPKSGQSERSDYEQSQKTTRTYKVNNEHLIDRLEAQNQVAELVRYRLQYGEGQDIFWGRVTVYDTKAKQLLADITNPITVTPRSMGFDLSSDTLPYAVVGIVPGKPTASALSPYQKITPDAFLVSDRDTVTMFADYEGNVATYPQMDIQTLNVADRFVRNQAPTARYDFAGDIYSLQFADGSAIGLMNPVSRPRAQEAAG